jgi:3-hydroxyisobutyrate dehydrogenase-like beta-hydroxyacid dehydrogenase
MAKDLAYAAQAAERHHVRLASALSALEAYQRAIAGGHGTEDFAAVVEPIR